MADPLDQPEPEGWGLVLPFVATTSHGGPYEDQAFVAGFQAGQIDRTLAAIAAVQGNGLTATVYANLGDQLDLIAMRHGFTHIERTTEFYDEHGVRIAADGWMTWRCLRTKDHR